MSQLTAHASQQSSAVIGIYSHKYYILRSWIGFSLPTSAFCVWALQAAKPQYQASLLASIVWVVAMAVSSNIDIDAAMLCFSNILEQISKQEELSLETPVNKVILGQMEDLRHSEEKEYVAQLFSAIEKEVIVG